MKSLCIFSLVTMVFFGGCAYTPPERGNNNSCYWETHYDTKSRIIGRTYVCPGRKTYYDEKSKIKGWSK